MLVGEGCGGVVEWSQLPVYLAAEFAGGCLAGLVYASLNTRRALREAPEPAPATTQGVLS
jgi:glycerol uptake facilitator protein